MNNDDSYSVDHPALPPVEVDWTDPDNDETYAEAMRIAVALLPRLTQLARTAAETPDLRVDLTTGGTPQTDGLVVELPLLPEFANMDPDNPCNCGQRGECAYCLTVALVLHESAHITEGSTDALTRYALRTVDRAIDAALTDTPDEFHKWFDDEHGLIRNRLKGEATALDLAYDWDVTHLFALADRFNPAASLLINALEDARINKIMGARRTALPKPLLKFVIEAVKQTTLGEGWINAPVSYQIGAALATLVEYDIPIGRLLKSHAAQQTLADPVVAALTQREFGNVNEVTGYMIVLTEYCWHTHGVFPRQRGESGGDPEEGESYRTARKGNRVQSGRDIDPATGQMSRSQQHRDAEALQRSASESMQQETRRQRADAMTTQEREAVHTPARQRRRNTPSSSLRPSEMPASGELDEGEMAAGGHGGGTVCSGEGAYPVLILRPNHRSDSNDFDAILPGITWPVHAHEMATGRRDRLLGDVSESRSVEYEMRRAFGMNRRSANVPNLERGRLHGSKLARAPLGSKRVFRRVEKPRNRSYRVLIGIDLSGSTGTSITTGGGNINNRLITLAWHQSELLNRADIPFAIVGHTGSSRRSNQVNTLTESDWAVMAAAGVTMNSEGAAKYTGLTTDLYLAKGFSDKWNDETQTALTSLQVGHQNLDGQTIRAYIRMLARQRATDRILLYYTDGEMPAEDHDRQLAILETEVARAHAWAKRPHDRLRVVCVAYGNNDPEQYGLDTIVVDPADTVGEQVAQVVEGLAQRIMSSISK